MKLKGTCISNVKISFTLSPPRLPSMSSSLYKDNERFVIYLDLSHPLTESHVFLLHCFECVLHQFCGLLHINRKRQVIFYSGHLRKKWTQFVLSLIFFLKRKKKKNPPPNSSKCRSHHRAPRFSSPGCVHANQGEICC